MTTATPSKRENVMTSSASSNHHTLNNCGGDGSAGTGQTGDGMQIPLVHDNMSFDSRQNMRLQEIERRLHEELRRKSRDWDRNVEHMRQEFLELRPCCGGGEDGCQPGDDGEAMDDPLVVRRRGSTDVLDTKKMKALFLEYPDSGRRCKLRFNVANFNPQNLSVTTDGDRIIVKGSRVEKDEQSGEEVTREYERKIERPKEVDHTKLKSFLTTDGILIVEAPLPPATLNLRKAASQSPSRSSGHGGSSTSLKSRSPPPRSPSVGANAGSSAVGQGVGAGGSLAGSGGPGGGGHGSTGGVMAGSSSSTQLVREKLGVPVLREENGRRKVMLFLDIGSNFSAKEIIVQIIKDNRIQVKAKHEERTADRLLKNKFSKDYELPEKIETYSLRGGLTTDGKLMVGALIKGHASGLTKITAGELLTEDLNNRAENQPCNILDLSTFPPTTPALILASNWSGSG